MGNPHIAVRILHKNLKVFLVLPFLEFSQNILINLDIISFYYILYITFILMQQCKLTCHLQYLPVLVLPGVTTIICCLSNLEMFEC